MGAILNYKKFAMNICFFGRLTFCIRYIYIYILHQEIEKKNDLFVTHQTIEIMHGITSH